MIPLANVSRVAFLDRFEDGMKTLLHLRRFVDVLGSERIYALLALTAFRCKFFKQCSKVSLCSTFQDILFKAFVKLENLAEIDEDRKMAYRKLAKQIFAQQPQNDPYVLRETKERSSAVRQFVHDLSPSHTLVCTRSAKQALPIISIRTPNRKIRSKEPHFRCSCCGRAWLQEFTVTQCPLCHYPIHRPFVLSKIPMATNFITKC